MKYLACKICRKSSPVLYQGFNFSSSLSVPTTPSIPPCQLETHSGPNAWNIGGWDGFLNLCPLRLLFSFFISFPLSTSCFWPSWAGLRRWAIRDKCITAFGPFVCQKPKCNESFLWALHISPHLQLPDVGNVSSCGTFMIFPLSPGFWPINTDFLSWSISSLQTLWLRKFLLRSSQITYFWGSPCMAHRGEKKHFEPGDFGNADHHHWSPLCSTTPTTPHSPSSVDFFKSSWVGAWEPQAPGDTHQASQVVTWSLSCTGLKQRGKHPCALTFLREHTTRESLPASPMSPNVGWWTSGAKTGFGSPLSKSCLNDAVPHVRMQEYTPSVILSFWVWATKQDKSVLFTQWAP